jgi:phospholipid/cholesterol/gamma-HCH transport system permease protein
MIAARLDRLMPSRASLQQRFRNMLAAIGNVTITGVNGILLFASLAATVTVAGLRGGVWRAPVRAELNRALRGIAVRSIGTAVATGLLVGFALVSQAVYWLALTGQSGLVGSIIVILLVREFVPILVGLIIFGRSGTATLIELGEAQTRGWLRLFEMQGLDPLVLLVLPRVLGFGIGAFCLATVLLLSTLLSGYLMADMLGLISYSIWDFGDMVLRAMTISDFIVPPLKCMIIGTLVALVCCATGLGRHEEADELQRLVPRGFVRSAFAILLVNGLFDLVA